MNLARKKMKKGRVWLFLALLALLALPACTTGGQTDGATDEFSLTGVVWQWESLTVAGGETTTVPNPSMYTVIFNEDGTLNGSADCNQYGGSYTTEQGGVQITLGPTTMAFCGEESLDTLFLDTLGQIVAGGPDGTGNLALENAGGERRMIFSNGGAAQ